MECKEMERKYTKEDEEILNTYNGSNIEELMEKLGKSKRSVIAKLAKMGLYITQPRKTKTGDDIISKADLVADIESALGYEFPTLVKAGKGDLRLLAKILTEQSILFS